MDKVIVVQLMNATSSMHKMVLYMAEVVRKYWIRSKKIGRIYRYIQKSCKLLPHFNKELKVNITS